MVSTDICRLQELLSNRPNILRGSPDEMVDSVIRWRDQVDVLANSLIRANESLVVGGVDTTTREVVFTLLPDRRPLDRRSIRRFTNGFRMV